MNAKPGNEARRPQVGAASALKKFANRVANELVGSIAELALLCVGVAGLILVQSTVPTIYPSDSRWVALFVIFLPLVLSYTSFLSAKARINRMRFDLHLPGTSDPEAQRILRNVQESWLYERRRFRSALAKTGAHALVFGLMTMLVLALSFIVYQQAVGVAATHRAWLFDRSAQALQTLGTQLDSLRLRGLIAVACAAAAGSGFLLHFARILVRLANQDFNARMYSWACRSTFFVLVATLVSAALAARDSAQGLIQYPHQAVLLGTTIAVFGSSVLELIADKAAGIFGLGAQTPRKPTDLLLIEGLTPEDIERLAEEGVDSLHALAFVPTARLFFSTNHSLQRLVDWQDQALLHVYVGSTRAQALKEKMLHRGAIDLWGTVHGMGGAAEDPRRASLAQALGMDAGQLAAFVETIRQDQVTRRLHAHWSASVRIRGNTQSLSIDAEALKRVVDTSLAETLARQPMPGSAADLQRIVHRSLLAASARANRGPPRKR
jgi:hypothetical protein